MVVQNVKLNINYIQLNNLLKKQKRFIGDKYDYDKVEYFNSNTKVCIICSNHGEFWQTPHAHLIGHGCPICNESKLEKEINDFLIEHNIQFERQKRFEWLGIQSLDFYLPDYNVAIECQGIQHFTFIEHFGGEKEFSKTLERDFLKKEKCNINNINLLYYVNKNDYILYNITNNQIYNSLYNINNTYTNNNLLKLII